MFQEGDVHAFCINTHCNRVHEVRSVREDATSKKIKKNSSPAAVLLMGLDTDGSVAVEEWQRQYRYNKQGILNGLDKKKNITSEFIR